MVTDVMISEYCAVPKADGSYVYAGAPETGTLKFIPTFKSGLLPQFHGYIGVSAEEINADLLEGGRITGVAMSRAGGAGLPESKSAPSRSPRRR